MTNTNNTELVTMEVSAMNGKKDIIKLYDTALISHTENIQKFRDAGNLAIIAIANELRNVEEDESYKKAGFKSVAEYANIVFDYKRPTVSMYIRVAKAFIDTTEEGGFKFKDNIPNLSVGQMIELLPLVKEDGSLDDVIQAFIDGKVNDRMSTKKIRQAVQSMQAIETTATETESETETELDVDKVVEDEQNKAIRNMSKLAKMDVDNLPKDYDTIKFAYEMVDVINIAFTKCEIAVNKAYGDSTILSKCDDIAKLLTELKAQLETDRKNETETK